MMLHIGVPANLAGLWMRIKSTFEGSQHEIVECPGVNDVVFRKGPAMKHNVDSCFEHIK